MNLQKLMVRALETHLKGDTMPMVPAGGEMIWAWFVALSSTRSWHMGGPGAITFCEIAAYRMLTNELIEPRHVEIIRAMDYAWINHVAGMQSRQGDIEHKALEHTGRDMSPALFDAVFG